MKNALWVPPLLALASCCCRAGGPTLSPRLSPRLSPHVDTPLIVMQGADPDLYLAPSNYEPPADHKPPKILDFAPEPLGLQPSDEPTSTQRWPERVSKALPPGFEDELKRVHGLTDERQQRLALASLHAKSPDAFADVAPESLAAIAPGVLRVYDLTAVLLDGGDYAEGELNVMTEDGPAKNLRPALRGPEARLDRIRDRLASAGGGGGWSDEDSFLASMGRGLMVLQSPAKLGALEGVLDRIATTGGPVVRLRVDVLRGAEEFANGLGVPRGESGPPLPDAKRIEEGTAISVERLKGPAPSDEAIASMRLASYTLDVPHGRLVGARKSTSTAFVQDFDVEVSNGPVIPGPIVGTMREGTTVTAALDLDGSTTGSLDVDVRWAEMKRPMGEFHTQLVAKQTLSLDLPELQLMRSHRTLDATTAAAYLLHPQANGFTILFRLEPLSGGTPVRPGWRRVAPGPPPAAPPLRLATVKFDFTSGTGPGAIRISSSEITVAEGQRATTDIVNRVSYIQDFEIDNKTGVADPIVGVVADGLSLDFSVLPGEGAARVFDGRVTLSRLERPLRVAEIPAGEASMKIQLPVTHDTVLPFRLVLEPGQEARLPGIPVRVESGPEGHVVASQQDVTVSIRYVSAEAVR